MQIIRKEKEFINDLIGNYFISPVAKLLFNNKNDELVEECISRQIDILVDRILNNRRDISMLVNKTMLRCNGIKFLESEKISHIQISTFKWGRLTNHLF